jgi:SH3 domain-containing YSC84-like protein 1
MICQNQKRVLVLAFVALMALCPPARSSDDHEDKVKDAATQSAKAGKVFDAIMKTPDKAIPRELLEHAKAIAVFPEVIKAAFFVGGEGGRGVVSRRTRTGWSDPVFFRAGGGSFGAQFGASATDIVLVFMNDDAVSELMKDKFELGVEGGVSAGPVGRQAGAGTDGRMHAEILSYSRSRGLFAGVNLKGIIVRPEDDLNRAVYNKTARKLLADDEHGAAETGARLSTFPQTVARYATASGADQPSPGK